MTKKSRVNRMGTLINMPLKSKSKLHSDWLNEHFGCNVDKMLSGDPVELKKTERHFAKETLKVRSRLHEEK